MVSAVKYKRGGRWGRGGGKRALFPLPIVPYAISFSLSPRHKQDYTEERGPRVQFLQFFGCIVLVLMCLMVVLTINQETSAIEWKVSEHTEIDGPTDAFGQLEFTGAGQASRAKVSLDLIPCLSR